MAWALGLFLLLIKSSAVEGPISSKRMDAGIHLQVQGFNVRPWLSQSRGLRKDRMIHYGTMYNLPASWLHLRIVEPCMFELGSSHAMFRPMLAAFPSSLSDSCVQKCLLLLQTLMLRPHA